MKKITRARIKILIQNDLKQLFPIIFKSHRVVLFGICIFFLMAGQARQVPVQSGECQYTSETNQTFIEIPICEEGAEKYKDRKKQLGTACSRPNTKCKERILYTEQYCISKGFCIMNDQSKVYFPIIMCKTRGIKCPSATDCVFGAFGSHSAFFNKSIDLQQPYKIVKGQRVEVNIKKDPPASVFK